MEETIWKPVIAADYYPPTISDARLAQQLVQIGERTDAQLALDELRNTPLGGRVLDYERVA